MIKRCPQCGATTDDMYGFCIKCGYEFPQMKNDENICPLCQYENPSEADYCVKCGTPLVFKKDFSETTPVKSVVIKKEIINESDDYEGNQTSSWIIALGYIFSFLGGILGLIIAIYLSTRKDPRAKRHGHIQLGIFLIYLIIISVLFATGNIPTEIIHEYQQLFSGNLTAFQR